MEGLLRQSYFRLLDDKRLTGRWYLKGPIAADGREVDPRLFLEARQISLREPLSIPLRRAGDPLDFTLADFDMPVLRQDLARAVKHLSPDTVQLLPARIEGRAEDYSILNVTQSLRCLDESRSDVTYRTVDSDQGHRPREYKMVLNPHIDYNCTNDLDVFRIAGWEVALVVSERVKSLFQAVRGARFETL